MRGIYAEAKGQGFDVAAIRQIIKLRKQDAGERAEREALVQSYSRHSEAWLTFR
jgi:uncharacterized protein (UPF0335 family)